MLPPRLLYQLVLDQGITNPQVQAILSPGREVLTYGQLSCHLEATALQLTRLGYRSSDRLAVVLPNGPEMAIAFVAISSVCTCAPLNPAYTVNEYKYYLNDLQVKALVTVPGIDQPARQAANYLGIQIIELESDSTLTGVFSLSCDLQIDKSISEPILAGFNDIGLVLHTSGTTSRPKIVPITHRNIYHSVHNISETYELTPADRCLNMMPLFHIHGLMAAVGASLFSGASIICAPGFVPDNVLDWLSELEPTWYTAVPTLHQAILEQVRPHPEITKLIHLRFIRSCSSPLAPRVAQELETVFNAPVLEAYGMTEATHQITSNPLPPRPHKFGAVGVATGTTQVSIVNEQGRTLLKNEVGEICLRGENVISGYENNPVANSASFINGWLRTGDQGFLDDDGYLFIQGRLKELINRGGEKISPREIDEVLMLHPAVRQAAAFAILHPTLGEDIAAAVVLHDEQIISIQELRLFAASRLANFKVPSLIVFLDEIPKGVTGKIQRVGLAEKLKEKLDLLKKMETSSDTTAQTPNELKIQSIWQQVLDKRPIGIHDDFLALGGDSIMAGRILMLINEYYNVNLALSDIFTAPTIASMATLVENRQNKDI